jgi:hypothetical protein
MAEDHELVDGHIGLSNRADDSGASIGGIVPEYREIP